MYFKIVGCQLFSKQKALNYSLIEFNYELYYNYIFCVKPICRL